MPTNFDEKTYRLIAIGLDLIPKEIGYFTTSQIYDLAIYACKVNPMMTYEVKIFDNVAIVVHRIEANYTFCSGIEGSDAKENIDE